MEQSEVAGDGRKRKRRCAGAKSSTVCNKTSKTTGSHGNWEEEKEYEVEEILHKLTYNGTDYYFVKWLGYPVKYNNWEPLENLNCPELLDAYNEKNRRKDAKKNSEINIPLKSKSFSGRASSTTAVTAATLPPAGTSASNDGTSTDSANTSDVVVRAAKKRKKRVNDSKYRVQNYEPDCIVGAKNFNGIHKFLIKWKGVDDADYVLFKEANIKWPQMVIKFYQERLYWST